MVLAISRLPPCISPAPHGHAYDAAPARWAVLQRHRQLHFGHPPLRHLYVLRIDLDAHRLPAETFGNEQSRATSGEGVEDNALAGTVVVRTIAGWFPTHGFPVGRGYHRPTRLCPPEFAHLLGTVGTLNHHRFALNNSHPRRPALRARLRRRTGQDARLDEFLRERREVSLGEWLRSDGPDGTLVAP